MTSALAISSSCHLHRNENSCPLWSANIAQTISSNGHKNHPNWSPSITGQYACLIPWSIQLRSFNSIPTSMFTYSVNKKQHLRQLVYVEQSNPAIALQLEIAHTLESAEGDTVIDSMGLETRCCISEKISNNILLPDRWAFSLQYRKNKIWSRV